MEAQRRPQSRKGCGGWPSSTASTTAAHLPRRPRPRRRRSPRRCCATPRSLQLVSWTAQHPLVSVSLARCGAVLAAAALAPLKGGDGSVRYVVNTATHVGVNARIRIEAFDALGVDTSGETVGEPLPRFVVLPKAEPPAPPTPPPQPPPAPRPRRTSPPPRRTASPSPPPTVGAPQPDTSRTRKNGRAAGHDRRSLKPRRAGTSACCSAHSAGLGEPCACPRDAFVVLSGAAGGARAVSRRAARSKAARVPVGQGVQDNKLGGGSNGRASAGAAQV
jgi:hypothetical protein